MIVKFVKGHSVLKFGKSIKTEWDTRTSQEGRVTVPPIPQGDILIQVIAKNYQTFGDTFSVDEAEKNDHDQAESAAGAILRGRQEALIDRGNSVDFNHYVARQFSCLHR